VWNALYYVSCLLFEFVMISQYTAVGSSVLGHVLSEVGSTAAFTPLIAFILKVLDDG
jgi:hypothetical protein